MVVALTIAAAGLGAVVVRRGSGDAVLVTSAEGGVSLFAPEHWSVQRRHPTDASDPSYIVGHSKGLLFKEGGFWVSRWPVPATTTLDAVKARMAANHTERRHNVEVGDGELAGRPAAVLRYRRSPHGLRRLRLGDTTYVVRQILVGGFTYQVGTWTAPRPGRVADELDRLVASVELHAPQPWTAHVGDTTLRIPGGWRQLRTKVRGARFFAAAPGDPESAWVYVLHDKHDPATSAAIARKSIPANRGTITSEQAVSLRGHDATRIDFTFPDRDFPPAHDVEWFVSDGRGGTWVLAVGRRSGDASIADQLVAGFVF
jgi:hypothetical protein